MGMTKSVDHLPEVQKLYDVASTVLDFDIRSLCLTGPQTTLDETIYCQPAMVIASLAAVEQLKLKSPEILAGCKAAAGFSVGELTALIFAGALSLREGLQVVGARAKAMQLACKEQPGSMLSVIGLQEDDLQQLCYEAEHEGHGTVGLANYTFSTGFVLSGTPSSLRFIQRKVETSRGVMVRRLAVSGAFHSPLMSTAVEHMKDALQKVNITMPHITVYSNVTGQQYKSPDEIRDNLCIQITHPVLWSLTIDNILKKRPDMQFVEVGPGRQLRAILKRINPTVHCESFDV